SGNTGFGESSFSIVPATIRVTAPNTAVTWAPGTTQSFTWTHNLGLDTFVRVELSRDGGATFATLAASVPNATATTGHFDWTVSGPSTAQALARVTWTGGSVSDVSDVVFTIDRPPTADAGPDKTAELGGSVSLVGTAADPDGDPLTFEWRDAAGALV